MGDTRDIVNVAVPFVTGAIAQLVSYGNPAVGAAGYAFGVALVGAGSIFIPREIPEIDVPGIGADIPSNSTGSLRNNTKFVSTSDRGFARTSTNPQGAIPVIAGTYLVYGTLISSFLLGENDKRMFAVIGVAQSPITKNTVFFDDIDVTTLPQYVDVDGGAEPDDDKPWIKFVGDGGESGDFVIANSGKKRFNSPALSGEVVTSNNIYFFDVVAGKNEARIFLSVDVPGIVVDTIETSNADYSSLSTKTLIIEYVAAGITTTTDTTTFTDILLSVGADYTALNGKTLIITIESVNRTVTFTAGAIDAATTAAEIDSQLSTWADSAALGAEIKIWNKTATAGATMTVFGGTAAAQFNLGASNDAQGSVDNINAQASGITATVINVDEMRYESDNADNKRLTLTGTGRDQLNHSTNKNFGTTISYDLSMQEKRSASTTAITSDTDVEMELIENGLPKPTTLLVENGGNFYIDASVPNVGFWTFILEAIKATNAANIKLSIVEVMSDFVLTDSGDFSGIAGQTLIYKVNGVAQTISFGGGTNTAALAIIDINNQDGTNVIASASGLEIQIEARANPVGTESVAERKEIKITDGTAKTAMNFKPLYSSTENYDYPGMGYVIANIIKNNSISGNPKYSFNVTGGSSNPAQRINDLFQKPENAFDPGMDLADDINEESVDNSIAFDDTESFAVNMAILDPGYGEEISIYLQSGSLLLVKNAGRYKIIPDTDSQSVAVLHQTDDPKLDGIQRNSISWNILEQTSKFNVLRATYYDSTKDFMARDLIIDVDGLVDTENGEEPQIIEDGNLINISDSTKDFRREKAIVLAGVTNSTQALKLGNQIFKKSHLRNVGLSLNVSIVDYYLENGDIVELIVDELGFINKKFRIQKIDELLDRKSFGFRLSLLEHFPEIYV